MNVSDSQPRHETGTFSEVVTDAELLSVFDQAPEPFLTAPELDDQLRISSQAIRHRLARLHAEGTVEKKQIGGRTTAWWVADHAANREGASDADCTGGALESQSHDTQQVPNGESDYTPEPTTEPSAKSSTFTEDSSSRTHLPSGIAVTDTCSRLASPGLRWKKITPTIVSIGIHVALLASAFALWKICTAISAARSR